jgi:esterase/lipase superfamily enzyme
LAVLVLALLAAGCASPGIELPETANALPPPEQTERARAEFASVSAAIARASAAAKPAASDTHAIVRVTYATDRRPVRADARKIYYDAERAEMGYGTALVSIPRDHRMGRLERPSTWRFWQSEDPEKHVVLLSLQPMSREQAFAGMAQDIRAARRNDALVFIHGYNVSFEEAAQRTAQMKYDLGFEGPAAFFSWPSKGEVSGYAHDQAAVTASIPNIQAFLSGVAKLSGTGTIYLVAHSMGNVGLLNALASLPSTERARTMGRFKEIVLAAPDFERDTFVKDILPRIAGSRSRLTLYASSSDRALQVSEQLGGADKIGDIRSGIAFARGLDTIDATGVDTSLVGHTYYADNRSIMSDMFYLFQQGAPPSSRFGLEPVRLGDGLYWRFRR